MFSVCLTRTNSEGKLPTLEETFSNREYNDFRNLIRKYVFPIGYLIYLPVLIVYHTSIQIHISRRIFINSTSIFFLSSYWKIFIIFPHEIIFSKDFLIVNNTSPVRWDQEESSDFLENALEMNGKNVILTFTWLSHTSR